ncbi:MAG: succinate dehydrogenase, cytochrome b556 subunit [Maricaulaceae bacterium]
MSEKWNDSRPMSPHLQIWRWHPAMAASILHRASAIICYIGLIKIAIGLLILACTGNIPLEGLVFSKLGAVGWVVFLWAFIYMALAQIRHTIWAKGNMLDPDKNNMLSVVMIVGSIVLAGVIAGLTIGSA